jgi:hypothetical protein
MSFNEGCKIGAEVELNIHDGTVRDLIFIEDALVSAGAGNTQILSIGSFIESRYLGNCQICLTDAAGHTFKHYTGHTGF